MKALDAIITAPLLPEHGDIGYRALKLEVLFGELFCQFRESPAEIIGDVTLQ